MAPKGYVRDAEGRFIWPGQTVRRYEQSFLLGEDLPSWLITSDSSSSVATPAWTSLATPHDGNTDGYYRVGTRETPNPAETACLIGPRLYLNRFAAIHWEVLGVRFNNNYEAELNTAFAIGIHSVGGTDAGARAIQMPTADSFAWDVRGQGAAPNGPAVNYNVRVAHETYRWRNIGFLMLPASREIALTESSVDDVIDWHEAPEMAIGAAARPVLQLTLGTGETEQQLMRVCAVRLTLVQH